MVDPHIMATGFTISQPSRRYRRRHQRKLQNHLLQRPWPLHSNLYHQQHPLRQSTPSQVCQVLIRQSRRSNNTPNLSVEPCSIAIILHVPNHNHCHKVKHLLKHSNKALQRSFTIQSQQQDKRPLLTPTPPLPFPHPSNNSP